MPAGFPLKGGNYKILRMLGQGGFGITYEAEQVLLGRKVAVKEFFMKDSCNRDQTSSAVSIPAVGSAALVEKFREKFIREARLIASMNNPHIVRIYDVFEENETAYYVMEALDGGSLTDLVKSRGALPESEALEYARQLADALGYIHKRNVLHLDVKPSNVLLGQEGEAVLIDFGISKRYDEGGNQTSSTPVGISEGFAPGEQYRAGDISTFKPATDIYSLGATLYYLVTGMVPPSATEVLNEGLSRPLGISDVTWNAIEKAMAPRVKDRPQSAAAFLTLLPAPNEISPLQPSSAISSVIAGQTGNPALSSVIAGQTGNPAPAQEGTRILGPNEIPDSAANTGKPAAADAGTVLPGNIGAPAEISPLQPSASGRNDNNPVISSDPSSVISGAPSSVIAGQTGNPAPKKKGKGLVIVLSLVIFAALGGGAAYFFLGQKKGAGDDSSTVAGQTPEQVVSETPGKPGKPASTPSATSSTAQTGSSATSSVSEGSSAASAVASGPVTGTENSHDWVNLGLSVRWATCNIGASSLEQPGLYFAWGEIRPKPAYAQDNYAAKPGLSKLSNAEDAAQTFWKGSWRLPTKKEVEELISRCKWEWSKQNGRNGYKITGPNGKSIFLPAAGSREGSAAPGFGTVGCYATSSGSDDAKASVVRFDASSKKVADLDRVNGYSIRAVCK